MNTTTKTTGRKLNIVLPFEPMPNGTVQGSIRVEVAPPYREVSFYTLVIDREANEARFHKEHGDSNVVDTDMNCCSCRGYAYKRDCRHLGMLRSLRAAGKV